MTKWLKKKEKETHKETNATKEWTPEHKKQVQYHVAHQCSKSNCRVEQAEKWVMIDSYLGLS